MTVSGYKTETHLKQEIAWARTSGTLKSFLQSYFAAVLLTLWSFSLLDLTLGLPVAPLWMILMASVFIPVPLAAAYAWLHQPYNEIIIYPLHAETIWRRLWRHYSWLIIALVLFATWSGLYFWGNIMSDYSGAACVPGALDAYVPFVPEAVYIYLSVYWLFLVGVLGSRDPLESLALLKGGMVLVGASVLVHMIYPVVMPRPDITGNGFALWTLDVLYQTDRPVSCFPSTHCALALFAALSMYRRNSLTGALGVTAALAIGISTLLTRQHYVVDVVAGFILASAAYWYFVHYGLSATTPAPTQKHASRLQVPH